MMALFCQKEAKEGNRIDVREMAQAKAKKRLVCGNPTTAQYSWCPETTQMGAAMGKSG